MRLKSATMNCPCFGACGVTPQAVIAAARPEFASAITHAPGAMLVTDLLNSQLAEPTGKPLLA